MALLVEQRRNAWLDSFRERSRRSTVWGRGPEAAGLHVLVADTLSAWLRGAVPGSQLATERTGRLASGIEAAVREVACLDVVPARKGLSCSRS